MNTYNVAFVFGSIDVVYTIVCASEEEIDRNDVNKAIQEVFIEANNQPTQAETVIRNAVTRIREECGYNAVFVKSDANFAIPRVVKDVEGE